MFPKTNCVNRVNAHIHTHICYTQPFTRSRPQTHTHTFTLIHIYILMYTFNTTRRRSHTHTFTLIIWTQECAHKCVRKYYIHVLYTCTRLNTNTCMHANTYTFANKYAYIVINMCARNKKNALINNIVYENLCYISNLQD